jgi:hypothetical protein
MTTEAQAAVMVAAIINAPQGASGGSVALSASMAAEVQAWFDNGLDTSVGAVTFTDTGDLVGKVAHGLVAGDIVEFDTIVTTTGISINTEYYVIASGLTADAFKVSATKGGAALTLTTNGTGTAVKKAGLSVDAVQAVLTSAQAIGEDSRTVKEVTDYAEQILAVLNALN